MAGAGGIPLSLEAETPDAAAIERGRLLFARGCVFIAGAATPEALPPYSLPEVALVGRSNVGKSSLLNALTGRRDLARVSATPGRTQQINFFDLDGRLVLVDLPGYGHAEAPKAQIAAWTRHLRAYLRGRPTLARALLLIDARHGAKDHDRDMMALLDESAVVFHLVLTKTDKLKPAELAGRIAASRDELRDHPAGHPALFPTSAETGVGIPSLRAALAQLAKGA